MALSRPLCQLRLGAVNPSLPTTSSLVPAALHSSSSSSSVTAIRSKPSALSHGRSRSLRARTSCTLASSGDRISLLSRAQPATSSRSSMAFRHSSTPHSRLSLISRHLQPHQPLQLNTPYSTERASITEDAFDAPVPKSDTQHPSKKSAADMSSQEAHPTVLIPGPIEYSDEVLHSMSHYSQSHVGPPFVKCFSEVLKMLRDLFQTTNPGSQPFVISGSGTLGWDQVAANLSEPGDDVLVLHTGYFADSFADCFETYGVHATQLKAPIGERPQLPEIEEALKQKKYKLLTVTHVDTSTGVLSEVAELTKMVRRVSPETLVIVDAVCSVGCEDIRFDDWDVDVVMTASQKAIGCPAGLSIIMASERAMKVFKNRKTRPNSYYASWKNWAPIMQNYEAGKPSYFATPSPQLIHALHTALSQILSRPLSERFARHKEVSQKIKQRVTSLGLKQLASNPADQASGMTAIYVPEGTTAAEFLPGLMERGVVFAGGLHKEIAAKYVRFGHMGVSVMDPGRGDIDKALNALEARLAEIKKPQS